MTSRSHGPATMRVPDLAQSVADVEIPYRISAYARVGSTQDLVLAAANRGAPEGYTVLADEQSAGRGRPGARWYSPPGSALMLSTLLRPRRESATLALAAGLALAEAIEQVTSLVVGLKWPNDCLCRGKKLAGVLTEAGGGAVALGIGCNLFWDGLDVPDDLIATATACDLQGGRVDPTTLASEVLRRLARRYRQWEQAGFACLRHDWLERAAWVGDSVSLQQGEAVLGGVLSGISEDGELLLSTASGQLRLTAGEVRLVRSTGRS